MPEISSISASVLEKSLENCLEISYFQGPQFRRKSVEHDEIQT